jgi:hypothetical protein
LFVDEVVDGLYEVWANEEWCEEPIARLPWGEFTVVGFSINLGCGEDVERMVDELVDAGLVEDKRDDKRTVN